MRRRLSSTFCGAVSAALALIFLTGGPLCAEPAPTQPVVYAAYVLLAESPAGQTAAFARVIVDPGRECPALVGTGSERIKTAPRRNPHGFTVKVCEARYPFGRSLGIEGGPRLPVVVEAP